MAEVADWIFWGWGHGMGSIDTVFGSCQIGSESLVVAGMCGSRC